MMETPALWVAFVAMVPLMVLTAYWDLKNLKIPNWLVLCVLATFVVSGLWGLPFDTFLWRLLYGCIALVIGFGLFALGGIGGGDAKMAAALVPFAMPSDVVVLLVLYSVMTLALLMIVRLIMQMVRHRETGWLALDQLQKPARERVFPMGLIFGSTILAYLGIQTGASLGLF